MSEIRSWFQRPIAALCILAALVMLSAYVILVSDGRLEDSAEISYRISMRHYGSDAGEMERTVAIPLEDALSAIPGIKRIIVNSENGQVRAFVNFHQTRRRSFSGRDDYYQAVREVAQRVYETLPSSAQRPELVSSSDVRIPFWTAAVYSPSGDEPDGTILERIVKPALNSIEGVGEVEIAGPGIREIIIAMDQERSAAGNISPGKLSAVLAGNDALFFGGFIHHEGFEIPIKVDGRYASAKALAETLIPLDSGALVSLKTIAAIREENRQADTLSRLNGKKTAVISVTAASGFDHGVLSNRIKKEMETLSSLPLEFVILEDRGAEEARAFKSVLVAALQASFLVAFSTLLLSMGRSGGLRNGLICAGAIPLMLIISAAILSALGFPVNKRFLAGLALGVGAAVDAVILSADAFGRSGNASDGITILKRICSPLILGAATSIAALLPLIGISAGDIRIIAAALGTVSLVSVVIALVLLPSLFLWESFRAESFVPSRLSSCLSFHLPHRLWRRHRRSLSRNLWRFFAALLSFCCRRPLVSPALSFAISAAAVFSLVIAGADTSAQWAENSVYAQIEFEGGFLKEEADILLAAWAGAIKNHGAVNEVQTSARTGQGHALVTFDPRKSGIAEIRNHIRKEIIPGAFIFIPESSPGDRIWTITVSGDEAETCRELARMAASLCSYMPLVKEAVLNFKQGGPRLSLFPRRELLAQGGLSFSYPANTIRQGLHGPVVYKRNEGQETDVRILFAPIGISGTGNTTLSGEDILRIPLATNSGIVQAASILEGLIHQENSGIQRENRRRIASFSIRTNPGDPRFFQSKVMETLNDIQLPPGYKIEFDPEAISQAKDLSGKLFNFIWAILFCYMIIAAAEESFLLPLIILSAIPVSLALPVLVFTLSGLPVNTAVACALIAVSGMSVNASVISAGELRQHGAGTALCVYRSLRKRFSVLLATTGTTIAGVLPFLLLSEGSNALVRTLALVTVLGVSISFFCALSLVPSLMNLYFRFRVRRNLIL